MVVPTAQLKIFRPLDTFPPAERVRWTDYIRDQGGLTRHEVATAEAAYALRRLVQGSGPTGAPAAAVRRLGAEVVLCPLDLELRWLVGFERFREQVPVEALGAFVPRPRRTATAFGAAAPSGPPSWDRPPQILDAAWAVPLHWYVAFDPSEQRLTDPPEGLGPRVVLLTTVAVAQQRVRRAQQAVSDALQDDEMVDMLGELLGWLCAFDGRSVLELDYAGLTETFSREELATDRTCADVWSAVRALEDGDGFAAAAAYGVARARWRDRYATQYVN